jgi:hypothetical protein
MLTAHEDDPIRSLLADIPTASMIRTPPGMVAILCSRIEAAGGDLDAVVAWVEQHDGYMDRTAPIRSRGLRPGQKVAREAPGEVYFAVPSVALR